MRRARLLAGAALIGPLLVALLLGACAPAPMLATGAVPESSPAPPARGTLRLAVNDRVSSTYSAVHIAQREGYFLELGLDLDVQSANPPTATQALLAGQFDVAHAASPGLAAALKGAPLRLVYLVAEPAMHLIVARNELQAWGDLRGKTIAVSSTSGSQVQDVSRVLALKGVNTRDDGVSFVVPGGTGDEHKLAALRAGTVDAGMFSGLGAVAALADGYTLIGDMRAIRTLDQSYWATTAALNGKRELLDAFVLGTLKGMRIYRHYPERAVEHVRRQIGGNRTWATRMVEMNAPYSSDDGLPSEEGLREAVQRLETGETPSVAPDQLVAWDILRQANATLASSGWQP